MRETVKEIEQLLESSKSEHKKLWKTLQNLRRMGEVDQLELESVVEQVDRVGATIDEYEHHLELSRGLMEQVI